MKVALVIMPYYRRESPPAELGMLTAILRKEGHKVLPFDLNNGIFNRCFKARRYWKYLHLESDPYRDEEFFLETKPILESLAEAILKTNPAAVIFYYFGNIEGQTNKMAALIKSKNRNIPIIFTGLLHRDQETRDRLISNQHKLVQDFTIIGYDEIVLPKFVSSLGNHKEVSLEFDRRFKRSGKIIDCTEGPFLKNLDDLPFFDYRGFDLSAYKIPSRIEIFTSRSCVWKCRFCLDWKIQGVYRSMSGKRIFAEFRHQLETHKGINHIRLVDLAINSDIKSLSEFCELMIEFNKTRSQEIFWSGDGIIHPGMTQDFCRKLRKAGCGGIGYGLESGSDSVVKSIGKHFSISVAENVIRNTHNAGIKASINIITGFPTETKDDFTQTIDFIKRNRMYMGEIRLTFIGCRVRKDAEISKKSEEFGIIQDGSETWISNQGENTYEEREKRFKQISNLASALDIELRLGGRIVRE